MRIDGRAVGKFLKDHIGIWILIFVICFGLFHMLYRKWTAYTRDEQVNFAITAFAHHSDGKEEVFRQQTEEDGIREVNVSFFDISNPVGVTEYLLTYGYHSADIFILDTSQGQSVLRDCFYAFSEAQTEALSREAGFELQTVCQDEKTVGILVHKKGDDAYNQHFSEMNRWLLFGAEGAEYDYAVFFHADSPHNETANFELLKYILN